MLDASYVERMELCRFACNKRDNIETIIDSGADAIYRPLNLAQFQRIARINPQYIQMEVCRSYYKEDQLISLQQYVMEEYRSQLKCYNISHCTTIVENISHHLCYMHINGKNL